MRPEEDTTERPAATGEAAPRGGLSVGAVLKGSYRITGFIGEGGAGEVYAAEHISLGHRVAVKALFAKHVRDANMRRRFVEEAIIQANLSHPNITKVIDVLEEPGVSAIFMEFVDGPSLDRHLERLKRPEPIARTASWFLSLLDAMAYAHAEGVVHRDLKPANVLVARGGDGGIPKITDFGIAKVLSDHRRTETGTAMGTIYYAAPEQLTDAKSVDHRADIYSLGCTLYEMLTLQLPFEDPTMYGVMQKHLQAPRPDPARENEEVSRDLAGLVIRAMAVRPEHRFQTCAEFGTELRRVLGLSMPASSGSGLVALPDVNRSAALGSTSDSGPPRSVDPASTSRTSRPTGASRSLRPMRPGTISTPPRPARRERNSVSLIIWAVIAILAVGVIGATVAMSSRDDAVTGVVVGADGTPPPAAAAAAVAATPPTPSGEASSGTVAAVEGTGEGTGEAAPALPAPSPAECASLAARHLDFDPLGASTYDEAITALEAAYDPCRVSMESTATDAFERELAFLVPVQIRAVAHTLRAQRDAENEADGCADALVAATEAHRGLRRVAGATHGGGLLDYEVQSLAIYRDGLTHVYVSLATSLDECAYATIPRDLLGPEGAALDKAASRVDAPEPPREGEEPVPTVVLTP
jgi:serine/threonine protein kinase